MGNNKNSEENEVLLETISLFFKKFWPFSISLFAGIITASFFLIRYVLDYDYRIEKTEENIHEIFIKAEEMNSKISESENNLKEDIRLINERFDNVFRGIIISKNEKGE
jgi:uncharacterized protein (UPF0332 family)